MRTQRRAGPVKATLRRRENRPFVEAAVTVRRMPDHSIHLVVQAPGGNETYLRIDNLPRPAGPNFIGWAKRLLGERDEAPGTVRLSSINGAVELWVYAGGFLGAVNFAHAVVPRAVRAWAARQLGLDQRET
jgi:hypothetical protein